MLCPRNASSGSVGLLAMFAMEISLLRSRGSAGGDDGAGGSDCAEGLYAQDPSFFLISWNFDELYNGMTRSVQYHLSTPSPSTERHA
jgi:hypothetical protein